MLMFNFSKILSSSPHQTLIARGMFLLPIPQFAGLVALHRRNARQQQLVLQHFGRRRAREGGGDGASGTTGRTHRGRGNDGNDAAQRGLAAATVPPRVLQLIGGQVRGLFKLQSKIVRKFQSLKI